MWVPHILPCNLTVLRKRSIGNLLGLNTFEQKYLYNAGWMEVDSEELIDCRGFAGKKWQSIIGCF